MVVKKPPFIYEGGFSRAVLTRFSLAVGTSSVKRTFGCLEYGLTSAVLHNRLLSFCC